MAFVFCDRIVDTNSSTGGSGLRQVGLPNACSKALWILRARSESRDMDRMDYLCVEISTRFAPNPSRGFDLLRLDQPEYRPRLSDNNPPMILDLQDWPEPGQFARQRIVHHADLAQDFQR